MQVLRLVGKNFEKCSLVELMSKRNNTIATNRGLTSYFLMVKEKLLLYYLISLLFNSICDIPSNTNDYLSIQNTYERYFEILLHYPTKFELSLCTLFVC